MKIALIGYGIMGKLVEAIAASKGHEAVVVDRGAEQLANQLKNVEVAVDFSTASAVKKNVEACVLAGVPLVEGTTGWNTELAEIEELVNKNGGSMVFGANFSIGVNLFYRASAYAAELFSKFPEYEVFIEEQHHSRKKDAPSGTALKLKDIVSQHFTGKFSVAATRAGSIPGTHRVGFDGPADQVLLEHAARSREGFAAGAVMAAEWIAGKKGFYEFSDVIDEVLRAKK